MSERVNGLAPVVERALDRPAAYEALADHRSEDVSVGVDARGTGWNAAHHAGERLSGD